MKMLLFIFLLLQLPDTHAQNLLANGGFEDENICSEYRVNCAPEAWLPTTPSFIFYWKDPSKAHGGEHLMAMLAGHSKSYYKRIFIRSRIICGLRKDHQYQLSFFIKSRHPILDSTGVYFSSYDFLFEKQAFYRVTPTFFSVDAISKPAKADTNWQRVVINYTATGNENFITFGYFAKADLKGSTGIPKENNFLFLLDDIAMVPLDADEKICPDWKNNTDSIYSQNERHEYLDLIMRLYRYDPPRITKLTATTMPEIAIVPATPPLALTDTLIIPDILFATGSAVLKKESHPLLDSFCVAINKNNFDSLQVEGHTDNAGTLDYNMNLSKDRAQAVAGYIQQKAILTAGKLRILHYAYLKPVAPNNTPEGRRKNRRVVLIIYRH